MTEKKKSKYTKWGIAAATALFSIFLYYLNSIYPYFPGDDCVFQLKIPKDGIIGTERISSLSELLESQYNFYFNYHYRVLNHTILQGLLALPPMVFDILNVIAFLMLPYCILKFSELKADPQYSIKYFVLLMFIWVFHINLGWAYFPATGALNYTWYLIPQLLFLALLLQYDRGEKVPVGQFLLLAGINALGNENASVMLFILTAIVLWRKRKNLDGMLVISFLLISLGGVFMLLSPSVGKRLAYQGHLSAGMTAHLIEFFQRTIYFCIRYIPILLILLFSTQRKPWNSHKHRMLILGFLAATFSMVLAPLFEARSAVLGFFVLLCLMVCITDYKWKKWPLLVFGIWGLLICFSRMPEFQKLYKRHQINAGILEANRGSNELVYLERYCDYTTRDYLLCHENSEDPTAFDNRSLSALYDIKQVALSEKYIQRKRRTLIFDSIASQPGYLEQFDTEKQGELLSISKRKSSDGLDLIIQSRMQQQDPYFILRGSRKGFNKYRLIDLIPSSLRLYFLDFMEGNTLKSQQVKNHGRNQYNYFFIPNHYDYEYVLISQYSFESHSPIGPIYKFHLQ